MAPALAAVLLGYAAALAYDAAQAPAPATGSGLTAWLADHHLRYGLGDYWEANSVSLASGGAVLIRPVCSAGERFTAYRWESQASWYDPGRHRADFLVLGPHPGFSCFGAGYPQAAAAFGRPARAYRVGRDTVLVWDANLLARVGVPRTGGPVSPGPPPPASPR